MKVAAGFRIWREEDYIEYSLAMAYPYVDYIIIGYGPMRCMTYWKPDTTLKKIKNFSDPERKIYFFSKNWWNHPQDCPNAILQMARELGADYYIKIDGDEIFSIQFWEEFKELIPLSIKKNKPITCNMHVFWRDFNHIIEFKDSKEYILKGFPINQNVLFVHPDFLNPESGLKHRARSKVFWKANRICMKNLMHHYSYVKPLCSIFPKICNYDICWKHPPLNLKEVIHRYYYSPWWSYPEKFEKWWIYPEKSCAPKYAKIIEYSDFHPKIMKKHPFRDKTMQWEEEINTFKVIELLSEFGRKTLLEG